MQFPAIAALIAAAALLVLVLGEHGKAESPGATNLSIAAQGSSTGVWILDSRTARLKLCVPPLQMNTPPDCTTWGSLE